MAILVLAFYITKPFLPVLLTGAIIAYLSYPLYTKTLKRVNNKNVAAFVIAVLIVLLITVPFVFALGLISKEAYNTYTTLNQQNLGTNFLKVVCRNKEWLACKSVNFIVGLLPERDLDYYLQATIEKITGFIISNVSRFLASAPSILLNLFVMVFVVYYLLKDGDIIASRIKNMLPLKQSHKQNVLNRFHEATSAVFYGNLAVAFVQGILGAIGFLIFGIESPLLWGAVMMLFALVPYFGAAIIWLPAALNLVFEGYLQNSNSATIRGVALIVYGILIISAIDNLLKPRLIGTKAKVHPILVLLGILGGLNLFGFLGLVLGPVILALVMTVIEIYEEEKTELEKYF